MTIPPCAYLAHPPLLAQVLAEALRERERIYPGWNKTTTTKTVTSLMYMAGGSCDRKCGGWSSGCWCDAICHLFKDCCYSKCEFCQDHAMWGPNNYCLPPPAGVCKDHCAMPGHDDGPDDDSGCKCWANNPSAEKFCESGEFDKDPALCASSGTCHWGPEENPACSKMIPTTASPAPAMPPAAPYYATKEMKADNVLQPEKA